MQLDRTMFFLCVFIFSAAMGSRISSAKNVWLTAAKGKGLEVSGGFSRQDDQIYMDLTFSNRGRRKKLFWPFLASMQFNKNSFGLTPAVPVEIKEHTNRVQFSVSLKLSTAGSFQRMNPINSLQVALKTNNGVFHFNCLVWPQVLFTSRGKRKNKNIFLSIWNEMPASNAMQIDLHARNFTVETVQNVLEANNIFTIATGINLYQREQTHLYQSMELTNKFWVLARLEFTAGNSNMRLTLKTRSMDVLPIIQQAYEEILGRSEEETLSDIMEVLRKFAN